MEFVRGSFDRLCVCDFEHGFNVALQVKMSKQSINLPEMSFGHLVP